MGHVETVEYERVLVMGTRPGFRFGVTVRWGGGGVGGGGMASGGRGVPKWEDGTGKKSSSLADLISDSKQVLMLVRRLRVYDPTVPHRHLMPC